MPWNKKKYPVRVLPQHPIENHDALAWHPDERRHGDEWDNQPRAVWWAPDGPYALPAAPPCRARLVLVKYRGYNTSAEKRKQKTCLNLKFRVEKIASRFWNAPQAKKSCRRWHFWRFLQFFNGFWLMSSSWMCFLLVFRTFRPSEHFEQFRCTGLRKRHAAPRGARFGPDVPDVRMSECSDDRMFEMSGCFFSTQNLNRQNHGPATPPNAKCGCEDFNAGFLKVVWRVLKVFWRLFEGVWCFLIVFCVFWSFVWKVFDVFRLIIY